MPVSFAGARPGLLQRKCACGTQTMDGERCKECQGTQSLRQLLQAKRKEREGVRLSMQTR
jgi:hypothetical protein